MQFLVDEDTSKLLTWNSERVLRRVLRMPFGITCATSIFQREMEKLFKRMENVAVFVDDLVITGYDDKNHLENLEKVLSN